MELLCCHHHNSYHINRKNAIAVMNLKKFTKKRIGKRKRTKTFVCNSIRLFAA